MSTEIKNTLFRFVSMRAPELTDESKQIERFILRGENILKGDFDAAISSLYKGASKWQALNAVAKTFIPLSLEKIKSIDSKLYDFSVWIAKNKQFLSEKDLELKAEGVSVINDNKILGQLWDNLFYQILTQKEFYAKEVIIQLLTANHFLTNYKTPDFEFAKTLLTAKVVLPKSLFVDDVVDQTATVAKTIVSSKALVTTPTEQMVKQQVVAQAELENQKLTELSKQLKRVEKAYQKEYDIALESAEKNHQKEIKPILDQYTKDVEEAKQKWCSIKDPNVDYDPNDPCNQPNTVAQPELPEFEFSFRNQLDYKYLETKLSASNFETLTELMAVKSDALDDLNFETLPELPVLRTSVLSNSTVRIDEESYNYFVEDYDGFVDIDGHIVDVISENNEVIADNTVEDQATLVSIGGVVVPVNTTSQSPIFTYQLCTKPAKKRLFFTSNFNSDLSIVVPDNSWNVSSFDYTVQRTDTDFTNNGQASYVLSKIGNTVFIKNINIGLPVLEEQSKIVSFSGTITFTNGVVKSFTVPEFSLTQCTSGVLDGQIATGNGDDDIVNPATSNQTPFVPTGFGVKQLGIADYNKVEQTTQGYIEGDVAHIENIMAREFKERSTRRLRRKEDTFTTSSESEKEQLTDTTSTTRFEMQSEVANVIAESKDMSAYANVNYEPVKKLSIGAGASYATHNSKEESTLQAVTNSKDITERALDRIVSKVKEERIEKIVEEFEENNSHGFDNRKGDKHVVGVFRWIDKVFKNQIVNYGKRLMFEFMVPQPGKLHLLGMKDIAKKSLLVEPIDPRKATVNTLDDYSSINDATLKHWASKYNVEVTAKPKQYISVGESFNINLTGGATLSHTESNSGNGKIKIPEGYKTIYAKGIFNASSDADFQGNILSLTIGNVTETHNGAFGRYSLRLNSPISEFVNEVPVSYTLGNHISGDVSATVNCKLTTEAETRWQQETFKAIIDAYQDALAEYNDKLAEEKATGIQIKGTNPGFYREFENKILRKNCISYLIDQNPSAKNTYGKSDLFKTNDGNTQTFANTEVKVNAILDNYAAFVKFMEQAFEWDIMSYNLYPYYWGNRQDWSSLYQYDESNDPLFRNFMQAGMARVVVTVKPGFEEAVRYYMQTGQIWNGGEVPVIEDELYLSIVDELRQPEGEKLGKAWPTRVPTALTILQAQSIGLKVNKALPFNDDLSDFESPDEVPQSDQFELNDAEIGIAESDGERHIENIDIVDGKLQLNTDDSPRQVVAQISIEALKNAIEQV
ncbi:hypothetical protein [uncultured Olleya sp.]|uniref:hypothetical protein n=1 Tax=uncultured Olleya sp. TaxID=757243 RepID=UPI0025930F8F|nr:hypothetical protein [uncultured Olleya sp.]